MRVALGYRTVALHCEVSWLGTELNGAAGPDPLYPVCARLQIQEQLAARIRNQEIPHAESVAAFAVSLDGRWVAYTTSFAGG